MNWKLMIQFQPLEFQENRDPELTFPNDDMSRFLVFIQSYWSLLPEDTYDESLMTWSHETGKMELFPDVLDQIAEPLQWLLMRTIPDEVRLTSGNT